MLERKLAKLGKLQSMLGSYRELINDDIQERIMTTAGDSLEVIEINALEQRKWYLMLQILDHPEFTQLVDESKITFAMIKPLANEAKFRHLSDAKVAEMIKRDIIEPLKIVMEQDFWIPREEFGAFYAHLQSLGGDVYDRVIGWMSSGAVTGLVLYNPEGDAINAWRTQMGPTNPAMPDGQGRTDRIRHFYARDIENNVVHGSDGVESAKRELAWFRRQLASLRQE